MTLAAASAVSWGESIYIWFGLLAAVFVLAICALGCIVEMAHKHSLLVKIFVIGWALAALAMWTGGHR